MGLVRQNDFGIRHQRPRDSDALLLPAGKLLRQVFGAMSNAYTFERFSDPTLALRAADLAIEQGDFDVLTHRQIFDEVKALEDEPDRSTSQLGEPLFRRVGDVFAEE